MVRDGPLVNLSGRGGGAKYKKKYAAQGKIKWKKFMHARSPSRQLTLKDIHAMAYKKLIQGIWWRKKIPAAWKFPTPPPNFSNGPLGWHKTENP